MCRHISSSRTMASKRRCRMTIRSRSARRTMSSGSTSAAKSGKVSTSSWMRASNFTLPTIPTLRAKLRKVPRRSFSIAIALDCRSLRWVIFSAANREVSFTPKNGHQAITTACPFRAIHIAVLPCVRPVEAPHMTLAMMPSADQLPVNNAHSMMRWHWWAVLTAGSSGSGRSVAP